MTSLLQVLVEVAVKKLMIVEEDGTCLDDKNTRRRTIRYARLYLINVGQVRTKASTKTFFWFWFLSPLATLYVFVKQTIQNLNPTRAWSWFWKYSKEYTKHPSPHGEY